MAKQRKTKTKKKWKKKASGNNKYNEDREREATGQKESANSTQTTKAHRTEESQTLGKQHCLWSVQKHVKYTFSQSENFQFVQFGVYVCVCVNLRFPLLFFLFARSVKWLSLACPFLLQFDWLLCSVIWSHILNNNWDILSKNYYRQNTSWLSVSNNALDHEIIWFW